MQDVWKTSITHHYYLFCCSQHVELLQDLNQLSNILHDLVQYYGERAIEIEDLCSGPSRVIQCPVTQTQLPGRPSLTISKAQIETLIELGYSYSTIARMFGVSERTLL